MPRAVQLTAVVVYTALAWVWAEIASDSVTSVLVQTGVIAVLSISLGYAAPTWGYLGPVVAVIPMIVSVATQTGPLSDLLGVLLALGFVGAEIGVFIGSVVFTWTWPWPAD
jgi:flagellar motor component MotA